MQMVNLQLMSTFVDAENITDPNFQHKNPRKFAGIFSGEGGI